MVFGKILSLLIIKDVSELILGSSLTKIFVFVTAF